MKSNVWTESNARVVIKTKKIVLSCFQSSIDMAHHIVESVSELSALMKGKYFYKDIYSLITVSAKLRIFPIIDTGNHWIELNLLK